MSNYILFVDDEQSILNAIKRVFRKSPYRILTASTVEKALELINTTPIAVLVSDYTMPELTGAELLAKAKSIRPETIRIILTGNNDQEATIESINRGAADRFLTKPWDDSQLIQEINEALETYNLKKYTWPDKKILNHTSFLHCMEDLFLADENSAAKNNENYVAVYFGIRDFGKLQQRVGIENIQEFLYSVTPSAEDNERIVLLAAMMDNNFCALLHQPENSVDISQEISELINSFAHSSEVDGQKIALSFDLGYCELDDREIEVEVSAAHSLISDSLTAYQHAKASDSGNYVAYQSWMNEQKTNNHSIESSLQDALSENEFVLHYQPKINAESGTMHGAEALIRWNSRSLGMVPPFEFIPIAERSDIINEIGQWVMQEAVRQWLEWFSESEVQPIVSVNVSPRQLKDRTFVNRVESVLTASGIDPSKLELEITESLMVEDINTTIGILNDIKKLGVALSIDDFGTGYSSLSYLSKLPVDTLKIDRSFILPMLESQENADLVSNLIKLGHDLGIAVVAEGVEDAEQLKALQECGCDVIQGYFYSPPVAASDYTQLISQYPPGYGSDNELTQTLLARSA